MRQAEKARGMEAQERKKVLKCMQSGDTETAKIYAENAIRNKKEALNVQRFGVKM